MISSKKHIKYGIEENYPGWLNKGPWYNTAICYKLHGTVLEYFIRNFGTDRYNIRCYITAHDKQQPTYVNDASSCGGISIPNNETTAALELLGVTLNLLIIFLNTFITIIKLYGKCITKL